MFWWSDVTHCAQLALLNEKENYLPRLSVSNPVLSLCSTLPFEAAEIISSGSFPFTDPPIEVLSFSVYVSPNV